MRNFAGLVLNEWLKMFKKRSFAVPFILLAGIVAFIAYVLNSFSGGDVGTALEFANTVVSTRGIGQVVTLLTIAVTAGIVAREHSLGTIKLLLIRAQSRSKILASKYTALIIYTLLITAFTLVLGTVVGLAVFGSSEGTQTWESVLTSSLYNLIYTLCYVIFSFLVGIVTRSAGTATGIGMMMVVFESLAKQLLAQYTWSKYLPYMNVDLSIYTRGGSPISGMSLTFSSIVMALYVLLFLAAAFVTFRKRDVA